MNLEILRTSLQYPDHSPQACLGITEEPQPNHTTKVRPVCQLSPLVAQKKSLHELEMHEDQPKEQVSVLEPRADSD